MLPASQIFCPALECYSDWASNLTHPALFVIGHTLHKHRVFIEWPHTVTEPDASCHLPQCRSCNYIMYLQKITKLHACVNSWIISFTPRPSVCLQRYGKHHSTPDNHLESLLIHRHRHSNDDGANGRWWMSCFSVWFGLRLFIILKKQVGCYFLKQARVGGNEFWKILISYLSDSIWQWF